MVQQNLAPWPGWGLEPDPPAVCFDDLLADRQPDSGARVLVAGMQPLEDGEDAVSVLRFDPDAVVGYGELPFAVPAGRGYLDPGRLAAAELDGVTDQVLEQLDQPRQLTRTVGSSPATTWAPVSSIAAARSSCTRRMTSLQSTSVAPSLVRPMRE